MLDQISKADFAEQMHSEFFVHVKDDEQLPVQLVEVIELPGSPTEGRRQPFSICFLGPPEVLLNQRIYRLSHSAMSDLDIFLVPIGPDDAGNGLLYEAVFT